VTINPGFIQPIYLADSLDIVAQPVGGVPGYTYAWGPANIFGSPTSAIAKVKFNDLVTVNEVTLKTTDSNGCIALDTSAVDYSISAAEMNSLDIDMNIYPNPNSGTFSVSLKGKPTGQGMELVVLDALGRMVYSEQLARFAGTLNKELDLSGLSEGAYFLGFYSDGKQVFKKLMIH
jgi:hypothetical protein